VLTGRVLEAETGIPLAGALVTALPQSVTALSDGEGRFRIEGIDPGMVR
jgi:hypothetical protein